MTVESVEEITKLVQTELEKISLPEIIAALRPLLVTPKMHMRNWDYGEPGEVLPCWTVLEHHPS